MTTLLDYPVEDKQHAIAAEVEYWESIPLDDLPIITAPEPEPEWYYNQGFRDGFAGKDHDLEHRWSLDYMAGYTDAVADSILSGNSVQFCLTHTEFDEW